MPCYDPRDSSPDVNASAIRNKAMIEFTHNSPVAEMLCSVMTAIHPRDQEILAAKIPSLGHWWKEHQARDKAKEKS